MIRLVRLLGFVAFLASLAATGWWWMAVAGRTLPFTSVRALSVDAALFTLFALHHSLLARTRAKQLVESILPTTLVRTSYVVVASALLSVTIVAWHPVGGLVYHARGGAALLLQGVQAVGLIVGALAARRISVGELGGWRDPEPAAPLEATGPYGLVRHPIYLSVVLLLAGTPHMTGDRLLFAALSVAYIVIAMPFEEAGLAAAFGPGYAAYRRQVPWRLIPYLH